MEYLPIILVFVVLLPVFIGLAIIVLPNYLSDETFRKWWEFYYKNIDTLGIINVRIDRELNVNSAGELSEYFLWKKVTHSKYWDTTSEKFDVTKQGAARWLRRRGLEVGEDKNSLIAFTVNDKKIIRKKYG